MFQTSYGEARIAFRREGAGPAVLLLHASGCDAGEWRGLVDRLGGRCTSIAVDLHGHGDSDPWPGLRPLSLADEAAAALACLESVAGPFHLVGHSYGGAVALRLAVTCPERVRSLTLIEPVAFHLLRDRGSEEAPLLLEIGRIAQAVSQAAASGDYEAGLARFVDYWNGTGAWGAMKPAGQRELKQRIGAIATHFWATLTETMRLADLARIACPTQLLLGERTTRVAERVTELAWDAILGARLLRVEGAGHMLPLTHPETVNCAVGDFIAAVEAGRAPGRCRPAA